MVQTQWSFLYIDHLYYENKIQSFMRKLDMKPLITLRELTTKFRKYYIKCKIEEKSQYSARPTIIIYTHNLDLTNFK